MPRPSAAMPAPLGQTTIPLPVHTRGKVRDVYVLDDFLLMVATDRLSAFDHVLPTPIPDKGRILTQLSAFWFTHTQTIVGNHMVTVRTEEMGALMPSVVFEEVRPLDGRVMLVRKALRVDVECVARGYLAGSAWDEYQRMGAVAGIPLPAGLRPGDALPEVLFTPATKAAHGHDENITFAQMTDLVGTDTAMAVRALSTALYTSAAQHARQVGLILADTKFEFGVLDGRIALIDEALTPDSSRYWDAEAYPGSLIAYDKQYVRDYLTQCGWDRKSSPPELPPAVVEATRGRYLETHRRLTGHHLDELYAT